MSSRGVYNLKTKTIMAYAFRIKLYIIAVLAVGLFFMTANTVAAATYTVTSTADSGANTFRQALTDTNANPGADEITFNIAGTGPHEIITTSYLPEIVGETFINGASQPGTICGTDNMQPQIVIKGYSMVYFTGAADGSSLRGVAFPDQAELSEAPVYVEADDFSITCSMFGSQDGSTLGDSGRLRIFPNTTGVTIGGDNETDRNIFAHTINGIPLDLSSGSTGTVKNAYFGLRPNGTASLSPNSGSISGPIVSGSYSEWLLENNVIAGSTAIQPDLISNSGIMTLKSNYIGTDKSKTLDLSSSGPALAGYSNSYALVGGTNFADKNYIYNYGRGLYSGSGAFTALGNEFIENNTPIDKYYAPVIVDVNEIGGDTEYTVQLGYDFTNGKNYMIEMFENANAVNGAGGLDTETRFAQEVVNKTDFRQLFTLTLPGTGHNNPTITATEIDENADSGFGQTSRVGRQYDNTDIQIETTDNSTEVNVGTTDHEITQTFTNLGPTSVTHMDFGALNVNCFTVDTITESGTATDTGVYDNLDWDGALEPSQNLVLTFTGSTNCGPGNNIYFSHGNLDFMHNGIEEIFEINYENDNNYDDDTEIVSLDDQADLSVTNTLKNPEDLAIGETLNYTLTLKNNGPADIDIGDFDGSGQNPFATSLFMNIVPFELNFVSGSSTNSDIDCGLFPLNTNDPQAAALFSNYPDHDLIQCAWASGSNILSSGQSVSTDISYVIDGSSDLDFITHTMSGWPQQDPDFPTLIDPFQGSQNECAGYTGILHCYAGTGINNYAASAPLADLRLEKNLVNTGNIKANDTVDYDITVFNDGPMAIDLNQFSAGNRALITDIYPGADLTFVDSDDANISCQDLGPGSVAYVGPAGEDHDDHQLMVCAFTGNSQILASGSSTTIRLSFTADSAISNSFTNYAFHNILSTDPDTTTINSALGTATQDILDTFTNENFAKATYASTDNDNDGIPNSVEDAGPNSGDANNDGTPDSEQDNVTSYVNLITGKPVVLAVSDDCSITATAVTAESSNDEQDPTYIYPLGLMDFELACGTPGYTADISQYYFNAADQNYVVRKYDTNAATYANIDPATITQETIGAQPVLKASYQIADGGNLDMDLAQDGNIKDPAGLALNESASEGQTTQQGNVINRIVSSLASTGQSTALVLLLAAGFISGGAVIARRTLKKH